MYGWMMGCDASIHNRDYMIDYYANITPVSCRSYRMNTRTCRRHIIGMAVHYCQRVIYGYNILYIEILPSPLFVTWYVIVFACHVLINCTRSV
jgi:hypothetical protein